MGYSVRDYKKWRWEETKNYGYGPIEQQALPQELSQHYESKTAGMRIAYPKNWTAETNELFSAQSSTSPVNWTSLIEEKTFTSVIKLSFPKISVEVLMKKLPVEGPNPLETEVKRLNDMGIVFSKERENVNSDRGNWTVLTWEEDNTTVRYAVTNKGERLVVVKMECGKDAVNQWTRTEDEIIKSMVLL